MSRGRKSRSASEALSALREQLKKGKPQPTTKPQWLAVRAIKQHPQLFQHRRPAKHVSNAHARNLAAVLKAGGELAPVTVWWDGKTWACIDGHHRLAAYAVAGKADHHAAVQVFEGTLEDALVLAAEANTRDKLPMSRTEKSNAAWRLVVTTSASKAVQAKAAGVSERTVAMMRSTREELAGKQGLSEGQLLELTWDAARLLARGDVAPEWSPEEEELRVQQFATKLHEVFGTQGAKQPDIFLRAIELYSPKLLESIEANLRDQLREQLEGAA